MTEPDWSKYRNFSRSELECKCGCGQAEMSGAFMDLIQGLRNKCRFPFVISSGYRCPDHNEAVSGSGRSGPHTTGMACDISINGSHAWTLLAYAMDTGMPGIGIKQHGDGRFIHLDMLSNDTHPRPRVWSYE